MVSVSEVSPCYSSDPTDSICSVLLTILPDQNCSPSSITLNPGWFLVLCWSFCHNHMFAPSLFGKHYFPSFMTSVWIDVHYFTCCCEKKNPWCDTAYGFFLLRLQEDRVRHGGEGMVSWVRGVWSHHVCGEEGGTEEQVGQGINPQRLTPLADFLQ